MSDFCPVNLPEDFVPADQQHCKECGLYQHGSRMIWGEGNPNASLMIVLDNPGAREDKVGNAYVCGTRQTLQKAAYESGFSLENLYMTYILKRRPVKKYNKEETRKICIRHLYEQLKAIQPDTIFCMGNVAVQAFFNDPEAEVKSMRRKWHQVNGIPTAVAYHPLAVRRRPNLWHSFMEDWQLIKKRYNSEK